MKSRNAAGTLHGLTLLVGVVMATPMMATGQGNGNEDADSRKIETSRGGYDSGSSAEQASKWGLTPAEAAALQAHVDKVVAETGGTQVGINKVLSRDGSSTIAIPLPGDRMEQDVPYMFGLRGPHDESLLASPPPSTSPAPEERVFVRPDQSSPCRRGRSCASVPYGRGYYDFKFFYYNTYRLRYWHGRGSLQNMQTGGAATRLYDVNGKQVMCLPAGYAVAVNWDPIWRIRLTERPCAT